MGCIFAKCPTEAETKALSLAKDHANLMNNNNYQQGGFRFLDMHIGENGGSSAFTMFIILSILFGMLLAFLIYKCCKRIKYSWTESVMNTHTNTSNAKRVDQLEAQLEKAMPIMQARMALPALTYEG